MRACHQKKNIAKKGKKKNFFWPKFHFLFQKRWFFDVMVYVLPSDVHQIWTFERFTNKKINLKKINAKKNLGPKKINFLQKCVFFFIFWPIFSLWSSSNFKSLKSCHWKKRYYKKSTTKIYFDQNFVFHFKTGDFPMSWSMFCEVMLIKFDH